MRRPSCFLLEGRTEVVRDEQAVNVDESSYEVNGIRKAVAVLYIAHRPWLPGTVRRGRGKG